MAGFSFRLPLKRSESATIQTQSARIDLPHDDSHVSVSLRTASVSESESIASSRDWSVWGEGYASEAAANVEGSRIKDAMLVTMARIRVGVDTGERGPRGFVTSHGLEDIAARTGRRALNNSPGVTVFEQQTPRPLFVSFEVKGTRGASPESFVAAFETALKSKRVLSEKDKTALFLYNSSFFQPLGEGRLLLLVMAIEAQLELAPRSDAARALVDELETKIRTSTLPRVEKESMNGALRWLRRESISQAGRRLAAERIRDKTFLGLSAADFYTHVYRLRSRLVHGHAEFPGFDEVAKVVGELEVYVSDLLLAA